MQSTVPILLALCGLCAPALGAELNQLLTKYGVIPDPFGLTAFFHMPRTTDAAQKDKWAKLDKVDDVLKGRGVSVWCRDGDYRVCLMYDSLGSVAGIIISHSVSDMKNTGVPQDFDAIPDFTKQTILGEEVYSAIAWFVDPEILLRGEGRTITKDTNTAEGIWIEQKGGKPQKIHFKETDLAANTKYTRQGCLPAQGRHYFYDVTPESKCEDRRPYYMLYDPKTGEMLGFGVIIFGKTSQRCFPHRKWFINPPSIVAPLVTPNGPTCTKEWMHKYGTTSLHVFFRPSPWTIWCWPFEKAASS